MLESETNHFVLGEITSDRSFAQTRLKWLVNHVLQTSEIWSHPLDEVTELHFLNHAPMRGVEYAYY
jgi:hypothetical protein